MSDDDVQEKKARLLEVLGGYDGVAVAFSGGVDSTLVAKAAREALGDRAVAFTGISPSLSPRDLGLCHELAAYIGIELVTIETTELDDERYRANAGDRCFWCKGNLFDLIREHPRCRDLAVICDGANVDDAGDWRPGLAAADQRGVTHPLQDAGLDKDDVRRLAKHWGLSNWDKPAAACLASRIAYHEPVTPEKLTRVARAEAFLHDRGFAQLRVRHHAGQVARIEVPAEDIPRLVEPAMRRAVAERLKQIGFTFVSVDIEGFQSGRMNRMLDT